MGRSRIKIESSQKINEFLQTTCDLLLIILPEVLNLSDNTRSCKRACHAMRPKLAISFSSCSCVDVSKMMYSGLTTNSGTETLHNWKKKKATIQ